MTHSYTTSGDLTQITHATYKCIDAQLAKITDVDHLPRASRCSIGSLDKIGQSQTHGNILVNLYRLVEQSPPLAVMLPPNQASGICGCQ